MAFFRQDDKNDELSLVVDIDFLINQAFFQQIVKRNVSQFRKFLLRWHKSAADQLFIKKLRDFFRVDHHFNFLHCLSPPL